MLQYDFHANKLIAQDMPNHNIRLDSTATHASMTTPIPLSAMPDLDTRLPQGVPSAQQHIHAILAHVHLLACRIVAGGCLKMCHQRSKG